MNSTKALVGTLVVGSTLLGLAGQADAQTALKSYNATEYGPGHAFWLKGLADDGYAAGPNFMFDQPGMLTEWDDNNDGVADYATLMGEIVNKNDDAQRFAVDLRFNALSDWTGGTKGANYAGGRDAALDNWDFYEIDDTQNTLTGLGKYEGSLLNLYNRANGTYVAQVGEGANDKNSDLGMSYWFGYTGTLVYNGETRAIASDKSDINLHLDPKSVPEPASVAGLLMLGAVGVSALKRKEQVEA